MGAIWDKVTYFKVVWLQHVEEWVGKEKQARRYSTLSDKKIAQ